MIHIIITIRPAPLEVVFHYFNTRGGQSAPVETLARILRAYLPPFIRKVAVDNGARFHEIRQTVPGLPQKGETNAAST